MNRLTTCIETATSLPEALKCRSTLCEVIKQYPRLWVLVQAFKTDPSVEKYLMVLIEFKRHYWDMPGHAQRYLGWDYDKIMDWGELLGLDKLPWLFPNTAEVGPTDELEQTVFMDRKVCKPTVKELQEELYDRAEYKHSEQMYEIKWQLITAYCNPKHMGKMLLKYGYDIFEDEYDPDTVEA